MLHKLFNRSRLLQNKPSKELANPRRILMTHYGNTTEVIQSLPLLVALRHRFPQAEVAWLTSQDAAPLLFDHWAVNRFIIVRNDWFKHQSELRRVRRRLQSFAPHVAVDPQNSFGSSLATWLADATYRIGFAGKQRRYLHNVRIVAEEEHRIERNLQLLQPFGISGCSVGFDMPENERDRVAARDILRWKGLHGNFALLHISADHPATRWQEERYGLVAKYLLDEWNLPSLITWSGYELEQRRAESAMHASGGAAVLAPYITSTQRRSLTKLATIFVGSDTAELQIAAAVGTRCVGLFCPASVSKNAPFGSEHRTVHAEVGNERNSRKRVSLLGWMDAIPSEMVCERCDEVLSILRPSVVLMPQAASGQKKAA